MVDGGATFGVVPKPLWSKVTPADEFNRVRLSMVSLLARTPEATVLVEAGSGEHQPPKMQEALAVEGPRLLETLSSLGVAPEEIDYFIPSHLHFDHVGGASSADGRKLHFPNATHVFQRREWEEANRPLPVNVNAYIPGDIAPLARAKLLLLDGDAEVTPGVEVTFSSGHSVGHQMIRIGRGARSIIFVGDIFPTSEHMNLRWTCAFDVYPIETHAAKAAVIERALREGSMIAPGHGGSAPVCTVVSPGPGKYAAKIAPGVRAPIV